MTCFDNQTVNLNASLTDYYGHPLANQTVNFTINGINIGNAVTGNNGAALKQYTPKITGNYNITVKYTGNSNYNNTQGQGLLKVKPTADIQLTVTTNNTKPNVGESYIYTLTTANKGPDTATGVQITDKLPAGLTLNNYTMSQGTYNPSTGVWNIGSLINGASAWLKLKVTPTSSIIGKTVTNTANKTRENEYDPTPDKVSVQVKVTGVTINQLISAATYVKRYYESHHILPSNVTINNQSITMPQFLQLLVTGTLNINNGNLNPLLVTMVNPAPQPGGSYTSGNIPKSPYLTIATNIRNFIHTHGRAPNFAYTSLGHVSFSKLVYMYSKIINFYGLHNRLPNYVNI